jgi:hypothetical protein
VPAKKVEGWEKPQGLRAAFFYGDQPFPFRFLQFCYEHQVSLSSFPHLSLEHLSLSHWGQFYFKGCSCLWER